MYVGFDVYGIKPKNKKGEYFRNNAWWWRRLADFILDHVNLPKKETEYWHSNDGQKVSEKSALKIAAYLRDALKSKDFFEGWIKNSEKQYAERGKTSALSIIGEDAKKDPDFGKCNHPFDWRNVEEFAEFCENSGGFEIY